MRLVLDLDELEAELGDETRRILLEIANELVNNLKIEAPTGATGDLQRSIQILRRDDGEIILGSRLDYAEFVQTGTGPHAPPFEPIQVWARRVLGDEGAAWPVWWKIKQEGTDANPYVDRAMANTLERF